MRYDIHCNGHDFTHMIDKPGMYVTYEVDDDGMLVVRSNGNAYRPEFAEAMAVAPGNDRAVRPQRDFHDS